MLDAPASSVDVLPQGGSGLNSHSPFLATVSAVRELHKGGERSCVHVELEIKGCKATYQAGEPPTKRVACWDSVAVAGHTIALVSCEGAGAAAWRGGRGGGQLGCFGGGSDGEGRSRGGKPMLAVCTAGGRAAELQRDS